jgi:hypothetical protein
VDINYKQHTSDATKKRRTDIRSADSLVKRPKIVEIPAINKEIQKQREIQTLGIYDILQASKCLGFLSEDDVSKRMRELSSLSNGF